jgi:FkbH-like protein
VKLADIIRRNRELGAQCGGPVYRIALLSNIVVSPLKDVLELTLREDGINAEVVAGDYGTIVQDSERFAGKVDAAIIFLEACNLVEGFQDAVESMTESEISAIENRATQELGLVLRRLDATPLVLVNSFSSAAFDRQVLSESALARTSRRLNAALLNLIGPRQRVVDVSLLLAHLGVDAAIDQRTLQSSRALYSTAFAVEYSAAVAPAFRSISGKARKVLAVDADNTLWGGILGEDLADGLELNTSSARGRSFHDAQTILRGLRERGVLLALCTKNNSADVAEVIAGHPGMVLREDDFAAMRVNWQDKADNLQSIAEELNLGLDSFVFLDDSPFEAGLVRGRLPMVKTVQVPENISEYPKMLRQLGREFFSLTSTAEDRDRTAMYRAEQDRRSATTAFASTEDYLESLQLVATLHWGREVNIARAAQLTQKTNQFNVTTRRYTEADIARMVADDGWLVGSASVRDRYGDYGITALAMAHQSADSPSLWSVDTLLLSCRVIGRHLERAIFDTLLAQIARRGGRRVEAEYLATSKNAQVSGLFDSLGMTLTDRQPSRARFHINVDDYRPSRPAYIRIEVATERS